MATKRPERSRGYNQLAKSVADEATGRQADLGGTGDWNTVAMEAARDLSAAVRSGRIPRGCLRQWGPDPETRGLRMVMFPDDPATREVIAEIMGKRPFKIKIEDGWWMPAH